MASRKPKSPTRLTTKALRPGVVRCRLLPVEADQKVRRQADTFPADEQQQEALCQHQYQHEEHEKVQVGEEPPVALLMRHVADRVQVDQEAHARDDAQHDKRQVINGKGEADDEVAMFESMACEFAVICSTSCDSMNCHRPATQMRAGSNVNSSAIASHRACVKGVGPACRSAGNLRKGTAGLARAGVFDVHRTWVSVSA